MKRRVPVALLVVIDILLISAGVAAFYLDLEVVPQTYTVVAEPTRRAHPTPGLVAALRLTPAATSTATRAPATSTPASAPAPTGTPTASRTVAAAAAAAVTAAPLAAPTTTAPAPTATAPTAAPTATAGPTRPPAAPTAVPSPVVPAVLPAAGGELGNGKFDDKFTSGNVVQTATSYQSSDINVTLTKVQRKGATYYVQDIYVRYIDNLRTAFAKNKFGRSISAWDVDTANANNAIGAINGDWYGAGVMGAVIRNGVLYNGRAAGEVLVLFSDGTMKVYRPSQFNGQQAMAAGAYQAWDFGPGLMTPEGKAIGSFSGGIAGLNPRTAVGYFEPGHYAFVVVDGRQPGYSNGMTLAQLAGLFEELGCKVAYNLDGGQTSEMVYGGQVVNHPYRGGRPVSDIIFVGE